MHKKRETNVHCCVSVCVLAGVNVMDKCKCLSDVCAAIIAYVHVEMGKKETFSSRSCLNVIPVARLSSSL